LEQQPYIMHGAAKFLTTGKSIGIDIWREEDLSHNTMKTALENATIEKVSDKIEILTMDARKLDFDDNSLDIILSMFCIHNIDEKTEQEMACIEIARVLKPGGTIFIGDYIPTHTYKKYFEKAGLEVISSKNYIGVAKTMMWMLEAKKA
jgi:arsenite methyltransferase